MKTPVLVQSTVDALSKITGAKVELDAPTTAEGIYFIDVTRETKHVVVHVKVSEGAVFLAGLKPEWGFSILDSKNIESDDKPECNCDDLAILVKYIALLVR